jgi:hypothetical protein
LKIAEKLARAGMHIGKSTVERILKERPAAPPNPMDDKAGNQCRIVSKYPGHTWNADLTAVPISGGFWTLWIPNSISPRWPACWWVLNVIDIDWYNEHRPHGTLDGKTPNEVHYSRPAAHEQPRFEPRKKWPRGSSCAAPQVGVDGDPGDPLIFEIDCLDGRRHLPLIRVRRAA